MVPEEGPEMVPEVGRKWCHKEVSLFARRGPEMAPGGAGNGARRGPETVPKEGFWVIF